MTTNAFRGLLVASAAAIMLAATGAHAADTPHVSAAVGKQLTVAQKAIEAKDWTGAKAAIAAAQQLPDRTPYDDYMIARMSIYPDVQSNDLAGATAAAQAAADSPAQPDAEKQSNLKYATMLSVNAQQYDKGLAYAKAFAATNPTDPASQTILAQAYYGAKDYADAIAIEQKQVDAAAAAHKVPDRNTLEILMSAQAGMKDEAGAEKTLETLIADYNDPNNWAQMLDIALGTKGIRDLDVLWLGRLMFLVVPNISPSDASAIGQTASHLAFYGDAQAAQQHGGTGFPNADANAAKDKKTIQAQIAAGQKQGGQYNVKLAEALYGYGMYPQAEAAARLAMQKGGATDPSEPPMVLGESLAAEGKYDDALAAFNQVGNAGGPATPRIVRLWTYYVTAKKNPPAPATAAAH